LFSYAVALFSFKVSSLLQAAMRAVHGGEKIGKRSRRIIWLRRSAQPGTACP
jgi:hypothetical protein